MTQTEQSRGAPAETGGTTGRGRGRWIVLAVVVVALVGGVWLFLESWHPVTRMWVHGATKKEYHDKLVDSQEPEVIGLIDEGMRDVDLSDATRIELGKILLEKNRVGLLEKALKDPRLDVRVIALRVLYRTTYFRKSYLDDESYGVRKTVAEWLRDAHSDTRDQAASMAFGVSPMGGSNPEPPPADLAQAVRDLVALPPGGAEEPEARSAAAATLAGWGDCESAEPLLVRASTEKDFYARFHILQSVTQLYDSGKCGDRIPEDRLLTAIDLALAWEGENGRDRAVRMAALSILGAHKKWAEPRFEKIRARLSDLAVGEPERGEAMQALVATGDKATLDTFARWFHDPTAGIRATAARVVLPSTDALPPDVYESAIVGYLRDEPFSGGHSLSLQGAYQWIKNRAGRWVGLPTTLVQRKKGSEDMAGVLRDLFEKGEIVGTTLEKDAKPGEVVRTTRAAVAAELWRWLAAQRGVKPEDVPAEEKARDAFWEKAKAGDVAGAKAVLLPLVEKNAKLWTYERGWVYAHERP